MGRCALSRVVAARRVRDDRRAPSERRSRLPHLCEAWPIIRMAGSSQLCIAFGVAQTARVDVDAEGVWCSGMLFRAAGAAPFLLS